jgi:hypothetical protein
MSTATDFLGRDRLKRHLADALHGNINIQVNGPRRSGKTWAMAWLREYARAQPSRPCRVVELRLDVMGERTPTQFYRLLTDAVRRALPDYAELLGITPSSTVPESGRAVIEFVRDLEGESFRFLFIVDEFEKLAKTTAFDVGFFDQWRAIASEPNVSFVVASALPLREVCHPEAAGSTFWGVFTKVLVEPWSREETGSAMGSWTGRDAMELDKGFVSEVHRMSGGWPIVAAEIARLLEAGDRRADPTSVHALHDELTEQFADEVHHALDAAVARCKGARHELQRVIRGAAKVRDDIPGDALNALVLTGLVGLEGNKVVPTWPFIKSVVDARASVGRMDVFASSDLPTWPEWCDLAAMYACPAGASHRVVRALAELRSSQQPRDAWYRCREVWESVVEWLAPYIPPAALDGERAPRAFTERRGKRAQIGHIRVLGQGPAGEPPDGFDPRIAKMLQALSNADQFGAHHGGRDLSGLEGAAFVLLGLALAARAGEWVERWGAVSSSQP